MINKERSIIDYIRLVFSGILMGTADIIPGVSGGTLAFILGFYEELLNSIKAIGTADFFNAVRKFKIKEAIQVINLPFLVSIAAGIAIAIITLSSLLTHLLETQPILIWSFFFGLVVASAIIVIQRIKKWSITPIIALVIGTIGAFWLVGIVPIQTPESWWFLILSGVIAICAMILPGISGSFLLVMLGKYKFVLDQVILAREGDVGAILNLGFVATGAGVGIILFSRVVTWLFDHYHDFVVALLTGLMVGSLRKVYPWREALDGVCKEGSAVVDVVKGVCADAEDEFLATAETLLIPSFSNSDHKILFALGLMVLGVVAVLLIERLADANSKGQQ